MIEHYSTKVEEFRKSFVVAQAQCSVSEEEDR